MKLKKINEKTEISKGLKNKKITLAPEKEGQVLTCKQIKNFVEAKKKDLPFGSRIVVRGLNILKDTTLYSSYKNKWKSEQEWDDYLQGKAEEADKFKFFHNFTIDVQFV